MSQGGGGGGWGAEGAEGAERLGSELIGLLSGSNQQRAAERPTGSDRRNTSTQHVHEPAS